MARSGANKLNDGMKVWRHTACERSAAEVWLTHAGRWRQRAGFGNEKVLHGPENLGLGPLAIGAFKKEANERPHARQRFLHANLRYAVEA